MVLSGGSLQHNIIYNNSYKHITSAESCPLSNCSYDCSCRSRAPAGNGVMTHRWSCRRTDTPPNTPQRSANQSAGLPLTGALYWWRTGAWCGWDGHWPVHDWTGFRPRGTLLHVCRMHTVTFSTDITVIL